MFDFTVCMGAFAFATDAFHLAEPFLRDLAARRLTLNVNGPYPIASLWRVKKYAARGFEFGASDTIKLALKIHSLDLTDLRTLKEHLLGVDTLFLKHLTDKLGEEQIASKPYELVEVLALMDSVLDEKFAGQTKAEVESGEV